MRTLLLLTALFVVHIGSRAQQPNSLFAALNVGGDADQNVVAPSHAVTFTDSPTAVNLRGYPGANPVVILTAGAVPSGGSLGVAATTGFGFQLDVRDVGPAGFDEQILANGWVTPSPIGATDPFGRLTVRGLIPSCAITSTGIRCVTASAFEFSTQAIVVDPTAPLGLRSTGAGRLRFVNGRTAFNLGGNGAAVYTFRNGFDFKFYGQTYTRCWISANGFVSFTPANTGFANPNVFRVRTEEPKIMTFYTDLRPEIPSYGPRIYVQEFEDEGGRRKVKIVHGRLAEFNDQTGPHGGEIVLSDDDQIAIYVAEYQGWPSINTAVGITPGLGIDDGTAFPTAFGRDLSADVAAGTTYLSAGRAAFELFDHGQSVANPLDLVALGFDSDCDVGLGIVFTPHPAFANTTPANSAYFIR